MYFKSKKGNPLLALPTGSGKSIVQAEWIRQVLGAYPAERFLLLTHVKELITQNAAKLRHLGIDCGIYSAGLGRRELDKPVTVAGIQSLHKRAHEVGDVGMVIVDEAHLVSKRDRTMYRKFLANLQRLCPHLRVMGMTATPFRLDSGPLIKGDERIFTDIAHTVSIKELIELGYLAPLVTAPTTRRADTSKVKKRGGEYVVGDLESVMMQQDNMAPALDEVEELCADRKSWLVFCVGVEHAEAVTESLNGRGYPAEMVVGSTPKKLRERRIERFREGKIRALVSVGVLTTGFDAPNADALICLRPTMSPGLWVQIVGRVSRTAPGKRDGLVLDFTANTATHGPIDQITVDGDGNVKTCPAKDCPKCGHENEGHLRKCEECGTALDPEERTCKQCGALVDKKLYECPDCGAEMKKKREAKHGSKAARAALLSGSDPIEVHSWSAREHVKRGGGLTTMRVDYHVDLLNAYSEWICFEHVGYPRDKACAWWVERGGDPPVPETCVEAITRLKLGEVEAPSAIRIMRDGRYWRIIARL